jgi:hypothetical protein
LGSAVSPVALFFRPDIIKVDLAVEQDQLHR